MRKKLRLNHLGVSDAPKRIARVLALSLSLSLIFYHATAQVQLLKDVNTSEDIWANEYRHLTNAGSHMYYVSNNELWKSNGTTESTVLIKAFKNISGLAMVGSTLYFSADDGTTGLELWKSNGTTAGTVQVKDIYAGSSGSTPTGFTNVNGILYFAARNATNGVELWKSDGTATGTVLVKDILRVAGSSNPGYLTNLNGTLLFVANDGQFGYELWKSDGTAVGTVMVKDIKTGTKVSSLPQHLTAIGGTVYFSAIDNTTGRELWKTDGTTAGTVQVKDIRPGTTGSDVENLVNVNGTLFFSADDGVHGDELWKSNGNDVTTVLVKDLNPGSEGSNSAWIDYGPEMGNFTNVNGLLFFTASRGFSNYIYRSDGTEAGTVTIDEIEWDDSGSTDINHAPPLFTYLNGYVYFFNIDIPEDYSEWYFLYKMPYNGATPEIVKTFYGNYTRQMIAFDNVLYMFGKISQDKGYQFIRSDGTAAGTVVIKDNYVATNGSDIEQMLTLNGYVYFRPKISHYTSEEIWRTDGTTAGTIKLGTTYQDYDWEIVGNKLYWVTFNNGSWELWRTQGTPQTTVMVKKGNPNDWEDYKPEKLVNVNGILYYSTLDGELWRSDGTATGTRMIADFLFIRQLYGTPTRVYAVVEDQYSMLELWKADATGAKLVRPIRYGGTGNQASHYPHAVINNVLYFVTDDGIHGNEVWRTDGLASGTYMVQDLSTSDEVYFGVEHSVNSFEVMNNTLYITAIDSERDFYLWKLSSATTFEKIDSIGYPYVSLVHQNKIFIFASDHRDNQGELVWVSDGTEPGTNFIYEFNDDSERIDYGIVGDVIYFNGRYSMNLMRTDGTECGSFVVPTGMAERPWPMEGLGTSLIFAAGGNVQIGREPYVYRNINAQVPSPCGAALTSLENSAGAGGGEAVMTPYPNPYTSDFTMRLNGKIDELAEVAVYSSSGLPIERFTELKVNTDYEHIGAQWPRGVYYVKVIKGGKLSTHMVVKK